MRLAIISDIHGNMDAFEAVLRDIEREDTDEIVCLGDNIGYGAEPDKVVRAVMERNIPTVIGNHELAAVNRKRLGWFNPLAKMSLEITEALGDRPKMAASYHQLGRVAQDRGDLPGAESWYKKSLEIKEALGDRPGMAMSYGQLGLLAEARGNPDEALIWTIRCVDLFPEFPHPLTGPGPRHLARLAASLGMRALETSWRQCTGNPLPDHVRRGVEQIRAAGS